MQASFYADRISDHLGETPEGYLICLGARLARSGYQSYRGSELGLATDDVIECYRPPSEVLDKTFVASLNGKPVCQGHPGTFLSKANATWFTKGTVTNPRAGSTLDNGDEVVEADLVITDAQLIETIRSGAVRQLSVGYDFQLVETEDGFEQHKLRANHVAVVERGRAGPDVKILDAAYYPPNFGEMVSRFLGRNPIAAATELNRAVDHHKEEPKMTKGKLKQLRSLLDELLAEEQRNFAEDTGIEPDSEEYARLMRRYLGRELPRLGSTGEVEHVTSAKQRGRATDTAEDFESSCRALRLKLQRG